MSVTVLLRVHQLADAPMDAKAWWATWPVAHASRVNEVRTPDGLVAGIICRSRADADQLVRRMRTVGVPDQAIEVLP